MDDISKIVEEINKRLFPNIDSIEKRIQDINTKFFPDIDSIEKRMQDINIRRFPDVDKIISLGQSLARYSDRIAEINWESYEPAKEDIDQAFDMLENENTEKELHKEFNKNTDSNNLKKRIKAFVWFICLFVAFISDALSIAEYVENKVIPAVQSYTNQEPENLHQSRKKSVKRLNDELKKDVSSHITSNFRIVVKDNLIVRESIRKDSRIAGKLNTGYVAQIVEKRRNWTYVFYSDYKEHEVIEGWVFTRYLRQIN